MKVIATTLVATVVLATSLLSADGNSSKKAPTANLSSEGRVLFGKCIDCHYPYGTNTLVGPGLQGLFKKAKLSNGKKPDEATIRLIIHDGGPAMPGFPALSAKEQDCLIAYLKSL